MKIELKKETDLITGEISFFIFADGSCKKCFIGLERKQEAEDFYDKIIKIGKLVDVETLKSEKI